MKNILKKIGVNNTHVVYSPYICSVITTKSRNTHSEK